MHAKKNSQYYVRFQNHIKSIRKGQKLSLYFGQFDNIPLDIVYDYNKSKIIVDGQKRIYLNRNNEESILDDGFQSIDILYSFPKITNVKMEFDRHCNTETIEFYKLIEMTTNRVQFSSEFKVHIIWPNLSDDSSISEIMKIFKQNQKIKRLKFQVNFNYENVIKCIEDNSSSLKHLSLEYLNMPFRPQNTEMECLFAKTIASLHKLEKLSIYCEGESSFKVLVDCFSKLIYQGKEEAEQNQINSENKDSSVIKFNLKQLNFNLQCVDFIPYYIHFLNILQPLLKTNPYVKFRVKFPYSLEMNNSENAFKIYDIMESYPYIFGECNKITEFTFSTAGNTSYTDQTKPIVEGQTITKSSKLIVPLKGILKINRFGIPSIDPAGCFNFLTSQKSLRKLTIKLDKETNLEEIGGIIFKLSGSLERLNLRIRNNTYNKAQIDRFVEKINGLNYLKVLSLDIQFVEYIFYKLKPSSLTKLVQYKQGRMVKRSTDYTMQLFFRNDPIKLLNFFDQFQNLANFIGLYSGFEFCNDHYRCYLDPSTYDQCRSIQATCEQIFLQKQLHRKMLVRMILTLTVQFQMTKDQSLELINKFYQF